MAEKSFISRFYVWFTPLLIIAIGGCASKGTRQTVAEEPKDSAEVAKIIRVYNQGQEETANSAENPTTKPAHIVSVVTQEVRGRILKNNKFDYPVVVNAQVEKWIDYFTGRGRPHFEKYLQRSRYFIPVISKILKTNNMPQDIVYLAMIESGFNNVARSHASAVGPWQFIKATGRRYGLQVNYWMDQRRDTKLSTMAAIGYLRELYQEFGSWEVAAASYNAGENKLRTAIRRFKTRNFWEISQRRFLRPETRHYVPKIMAAAILTKNPEQFGFENPFNHENPNPTLFDPNETTPKELGEEQNIAATKATDAAVAEDDDEDDIAADDESSFASQVGEEDLHGATSSVYMVANPNEQIGEFEVKGPADLFAVSRAAGVPFSAVKMLNPELSRWCTPPSFKTYRVKLPLSTKEQFLSNYNDGGFDRKVVFAQYKVKTGDTISKIARKFTIQPDPIRELNRLNSKADSVRMGTDLVLPIPTGYKRVIASLYDEKPQKERRRRSRRRAARRSGAVTHGAASGVRKHASRMPTSVVRK